MNSAPQPNAAAPQPAARKLSRPKPAAPVLRLSHAPALATSNPASAAALDAAADRLLQSLPVDSERPALTLNAMDARRRRENTRSIHLSDMAGADGERAEFGQHVAAAAGHPSVLSHVLAEISREEIAAKLDSLKLDADTRRVVDMKVFDKLSFREMARETGEARSTLEGRWKTFLAGLPLVLAQDGEWGWGEVFAGETRRGLPVSTGAARPVSYARPGKTGCCEKCDAPASKFDLRIHWQQAGSRRVGVRFYRCPCGQEYTKDEIQSMMRRRQSARRRAVQR